MAIRCVRCRRRGRWTSASSRAARSWRSSRGRASTTASATSSGGWPTRALRLARSVGGRWYTWAVLLELRIENLLLIKRAEVRPGEGLTAITGETGAGKTVLAHALDLLLGGKPRSGIVRPGAAEAYVEGVFALPDVVRGLLGDRLAADADELVLARRVSAEGRTRAYVGGRSATAADLAELGGAMLSFYGQHEHRRLTLASAQLEILDGFCGSEQGARRERFAA